jgi:cytochrome c peroxidase
MEKKVVKARKGKGKKFHSKSESKGKKLDFSKVNCFHCHKHGHLATNCPQKKQNKKDTGVAVGEALLSPNIGSLPLNWGILY